MRKYECKSEIYMTTNLTVATASGKRRLAFCNYFFSETNSEKWKRNFTTYVLWSFVAKQTRPESHKSQTVFTPISQQHLINKKNLSLPNSPISHCAFYSLVRLKFSVENSTWLASMNYFFFWLASMSYSFSKPQLIPISDTENEIISYVTPFGWWLYDGNISHLVGGPNHKLFSYKFR